MLKMLQRWPNWRVWLVHWRDSAVWIPLCLPRGWLCHRVLPEAWGLLPGSSPRTWPTPAGRMPGLPHWIYHSSHARPLQCLCCKRTEHLPLLVPEVPRRIIFSFSLFQIILVPRSVENWPDMTFISDHILNLLNKNSNRVYKDTRLCFFILFWYLSSTGSYQLFFWISHQINIPWQGASNT